MTKMTESALRDWLHGYLADHLNKPAESIDFSADFAELGLDSVEAVISGAYLEEYFDVEVDATLFLRNRNINDLIADMVLIGLVEQQA
jgi:acyl carrier protein